MKDPGGYYHLQSINSTNRLYQFLAGIYETFDKDRRDLLLQDPLPTVEEAYSSIRREIMRREVIKKEPSSEFESSGIGGVFTIKGRSKKSYWRDDRSYL